MGNRPGHTQCRYQHAYGYHHPLQYLRRRGAPAGADTHPGAQAFSNASAYSYTRPGANSGNADTDCSGGTDNAHTDAESAAASPGWY